MTNTACRTPGWIIVFAFVIVTSSARAVTFTGFGTVGGLSVSAAAEFSVISANTLTLKLTNTTLGGTPTRTQLLTGVFFTIDGADPTLSLSSTALTAGSELYTAATTHTGSANLNVTGGYQLVGYPGGSFPNNSNNMAFPYEYGISTVGMSGLFQGNIVGNDNYAIASAGTNFGLNTFKKALPLVMSSVTFTIPGFNGLSDSQIGNVAFGYGSLPDAVIRSRDRVPEPGPIAMLLAAVSILGICVRNRRRA